MKILIGFIRDTIKHYFKKVFFITVYFNNTCIITIVFNSIYNYNIEIKYKYS